MRMTFSPKFDPLPTLAEEEELIALIDILRLRDGDLKIDEVWSICHQTCLALQSIEKTSPELFLHLCLNAETLAFNASGGVSFLHKDAVRDAFAPQECTDSETTMKGHIFSLGKTLLTSLVTAKKNGDHDAANYELLSEYFIRMCSQDVDERPSVVQVINKCQSYLKGQDSSSSFKAVCSKLTAWGRRKLSLEVALSYDLTHLKELSSISEDQSDCSSATTTTSSSTGKERSTVTPKKVTDFKKRKRSLPKLPDDEATKIQSMNVKNKTERTKDTMDRSMLSPPNLDAFGNLSERAQEILRKIYDTSEQESSKEGSEEKSIETERRKADRENDPKSRNNIFIDKPHLLKRNSIASVGTSFSSQWLNRNETKNYGRTDKSNSEGNIKSSSIFDFKSSTSSFDSEASSKPINVDRKYGVAHHDDDRDINALANLVNSRPSEQSSRGSSPSISLSSTTHDSTGRRLEVDSDNPVDKGEPLLPLDEDFILDDPWSEESDVDAAPIIKRKMRSHSIAIFNAPDPRSSAFRTPGQRRLSNTSKGSRCSLDKLGVQSDSSQETDKPLDKNTGEGKNKHPSDAMKPKTGQGDYQRRHSHSFESSIPGRPPQEASKRRNTVSDIGDVPSHFTSGATHFTPIIVAGENFVPTPSSKLVSLQADTKLKARIAFEAIKKSSKKERPPKTMAADVENDAIINPEPPVIGTVKEAKSGQLEDENGEVVSGSEKLKTDNKREDREQPFTKKVDELAKPEVTKVTDVELKAEGSSSTSFEDSKGNTSITGMTRSSPSSTSEKQKDPGHLTDSRDKRDETPVEVKIFQPDGKLNLTTDGSTGAESPKFQTAKVTVVANSPLASGTMFSPIDKPTDPQNQSKIDVSLNSCSKVKLNDEAGEDPPKAVVGGQDDLPITGMPVISSAIPDRQPLIGLTSASEVTTAAATATASTVTSQPLSSVHQLQEDTVLNMGSTFTVPSQDPLLFAADGAVGVPFKVGPQVSPNQPSPGVFSMQVQFQQDPQTGLFRMIPVATPTFSASPVVSSSPLLYSPGHPLASPSHSMSPLQVHSSPFYPVQTSANSPHRQVDTSSDPEYGHTHGSAAVPERKRDSHRRSNMTSSKKSNNSKRSERRLPSDSESSESSMFTPKSSAMNLERLQSKPGRLKTRSHSSTNLEKPKKHPKRTSADPVLCQKDGSKLINRSSDHSSKPKPSKGVTKGQPKASWTAKTEDTRGRRLAAVSPGTVSSPSRDSGVHMRFSMSSGEEPSIATETQPEHPVMLQRVMRHIRHAFAFDGYLENGVEDLQMAEYITALAHLSWSTFSSAVTEKFCDLYWEEELLERLYEEINGRKVDKSKGRSTRDPSDSPTGKIKTPGKKPQAKSKKSPTVTDPATPQIVSQSSPEKEATTQSKHMHIRTRSNVSTHSTSSKLKNSTSQVADILSKELTSNCARDVENVSSSTQRHRNSLSSPRKEKTQDGEKRQNHISSADMKEVRSTKGKRTCSSKQRRSSEHQQQDQEERGSKQRTDMNNDKRTPSEPRVDLSNDHRKIPSEQKRDISGDLKINETCSDHDNLLDSKELCNVKKSITTETSDEERLKRDGRKEMNLTLDKLDQSNNETTKGTNEKKSLEGVEKYSRLVTDSASSWSSSQTSKRLSSPSLGSLASLNTSLSLSESSYLQSPRKGDSDSSELSSTPTAYHVRQMLDCAITRSSSNASLNSLSSGNSSNQGLSMGGCLGIQGHKISQKLQQVLMYGADAFQQEVVEYSRRLVGKTIEKKIKEVEQQISVEKKMHSKTERFYEKLMESQHNNNIKGADHRNKLSKVREQLDEMTSKMTLLDSVRCYLDLTFAEQWGLDHSLLYSFAISQKQMHLQPHSENHMLQMKPGKDGISPLLQAGDPQGLFTYLFAKGAVMEGYLYHFLYTFRYLSKRQTLFSFITEKFQAAESLPDGLDECRTQITLRTMDICHIWLEGFFEVDFRPDPELMAEMISFISDKLVNVNQQGQTLLQLIDRKDKEDKKDDDVRSDKSKEDISDDWSGNLPRPNHGAPAHWLSRKDNKDKLSAGGIIACFSKRISKNQESAYLPVMSLNKDGFNLSEHTSNNLAEQLTLIQQSLFLKVHPVHYLNSRHKGIGVQTMTSKSKNEDSLDSTSSLFSESIVEEGGISELLDHSRMVSHWVSSEVVSCSSQKAQLALISKFIYIAKLCYDMRNFATCMQIMDGLNNLIVRQVPAWKNIPSKVVLIFEELEAARVLLKGDGDFLTRGNQHKTSTTLPCVHLVLMHIQQLEIGSFRLANGMYKWTKLKAIAECVDQIRVFQQHRYTLNSDEVLQGLLKARMEEFRPSEIQMLAASNSANFHQVSSDKGSRKFQSALRKVKANLH